MLKKKKNRTDPPALPSPANKGPWAHYFYKARGPLTVRRITLRCAENSGAGVHILKSPAIKIIQKAVPKNLTGKKRPSLAVMDALKKLTSALERAISAQRTLKRRTHKGCMQGLSKKAAHGLNFKMRPRVAGNTGFWITFSTGVR